MHILPLKNEDYWNDPRMKIIQVSKNLSRDNKEVILIGCPDFIPISCQISFPVVMVGARDETISYKNRFKGKTIGVCINLETGRTYIGSVHRAPDVISDVTPSPGLIVQDYVINLRQLLGIPWSVATYKIWFVYYDQLSNGIMCRLSVDEESYGSENEKKYLNEVIYNSPRRTRPAHNAISISKDPAAPKSNVGIEGSLHMTDENNKHIITIKGIVPVLPNQKVDFKERVGNLEGVSAIIPLDVVLIRTQGEREQLSFGIPSYSEPVIENGKEIGSFHIVINLKELAIPELVKNEKVYIYAFSGEFVAGPVTIE